MLTIKTVGLDDPYGPLVSSFFAREFPGANNNDSNAVFEAVMAEIIASNQIRFGPVPNPESLVSIREVVRNCVEKGTPVPVLTPFGSRKSVLGESLDIAELASLKQLICLQDRVTRHYSPGVRVNVRLEDASGHYLFADEGLKSRTATEEYCSGFQKLVRILGISDFVRPVLESNMFEEAEYTRVSDSIVDALVTYITDTDAYGLENYQGLDSWKKLSAFGWQGSIPKDQRDYYRSRYHTIYEGISERDATTKLARYFAGSWARIKLNGTGAEKEWGNDYIRVTFVNPVPGAPQGLITRNVYYRTLPLKFAKTHNPPWRSKGYLRINSEVVPKLASWHEKHEYQSCQLLLENETESVAIQSDYILCD